MKENNNSNNNSNGNNNHSSVIIEIERKNSPTKPTTSPFSSSSSSAEHKLSTTELLNQSMKRLFIVVFGGNFCFLIVIVILMVDALTNLDGSQSPLSGGARFNFKLVIAHYCAWAGICLGTWSVLLSISSLFSISFFLFCFVGILGFLILEPSPKPSVLLFQTNSPLFFLSSTLLAQFYFILLCISIVSVFFFAFPALYSASCLHRLV
jgi:hypothetical protein